MYEKKLLSALTLFLLIASGCTSSRDAYLKENFDQIRPLQETDLAIRAFSDLPPLIAAAKSNDVKAVAHLLQRGENVEKRDKYGHSALWYAFEHTSFESFKILLENGASPDFSLDYGSPSDGYKKLRFYSLAREHALYNRIKDFENSNDIKMFDAYFSEFSNGHYASETEKIFKRIVDRDYARMKDYDTGARQFMKKYSDMGQNVYLITANVLNIREGNSIKTGKTGKYIRGQQVFALSQKDGWLRTDRGWISAKYAKHIKRQIPVLASYSEKIASKLPPPETPDAEPLPQEEEIEAYTLETASQEMENPVLKKASPKPLLPVPKPQPQKPRKESRPLKTERPAPFAKGKAGPVQAELNALLENPTLPALEAFINKYKKNRAYRSVVQQAKDAYKRILLRTE